MSSLAIDPEVMREMGHRTVDLMVELLADPDRPALRRASAEEMAARLPFGAPGAPQDFDALLDRLTRDVLPFMSNSAHPGYMAFVPTCGTFTGALGDFVASALSVYVGSWMEGPGPSRIELVVHDWFKEWIGYPSEAAGVLVSGGSARKPHGARVRARDPSGTMDDRARLYVADQAHASVARAARVLGFRPDQVRVLPTDADQRLQPETVAAAIQSDASAGRRPLAVVAAAGATNTGAIDPLGDLAAVCRRARRLAACRRRLRRLRRADRARPAGPGRARARRLGDARSAQVALPADRVRVAAGPRGAPAARRRSRSSRTTCSDAAGHEGEVNFGDLGLQLSRGFRALKVWLSVSHFGVPAFRTAIDNALDLAELARRRIAEDDRLETIAPGELGITCFRRRVEGTEDEAARVNAALIAAYEASGRGLVLSTRVDGRYAVRLCVLNHTTRAEHIEAVLDLLRHRATRPAAQRRRCTVAAHDGPRGRLAALRGPLAQHSCGPFGHDVHAEGRARVYRTRSQGRVAGQRRVVCEREGGERRAPRDACPSSPRPRSARRPPPLVRQAAASSPR